MESRPQGTPDRVVFGTEPQGLEALFRSRDAKQWAIPRSFRGWWRRQPGDCEIHNFGLGISASPAAAIRRGTPLPDGLKLVAAVATLSAAEPEVLALPTHAGAAPKHSWPFVMVSEGAQETVVTYALLRRTLTDSNRDERARVLEHMERLPTARLPAGPLVAAPRPRETSRGSAKRRPFWHAEAGSGAA
jgi:hypothetical protein